MIGAGCAVCGGPARVATVSARLSIARCTRCGHREASHARPATTGVDYHAQYEGGGFLEALRRTRVRQAGRLLEVVRACAPGATRLLDFGCGRGWFVDEAVKAGFGPVAGADASAIAIEGLRARGFEAIRVDPEHPEDLDVGALSFRPQVVTMLDVVEHLPPERVRRLLARLRDELRPELIVVKVPSSAGVLHRIGGALARVGACGPLEQLYQVGTWPPHLNAFSPRSLRLLLDACGWRVVHVEGDRDFEAEHFADRVRSLQRLPRWAADGAGRVLAACADGLRLQDSVACFAKPAAPAGADR